jgi:hypothetical protein
MEDLERKNNGGNQQMTIRSRSQEFQHLEEEMIGGECRSKSPLPNSSNRCKHHSWEWRGSKILRLSNGV